MAKRRRERPADLELLDDRMQEGYRRREANDPVGACAVWLEAWPLVLRAMEARGISSLEAFDEEFRGSELVFNWVQDVEAELWNAGLEDPRFFREGIRYCEGYLERFAGEDALVAENMRREIGGFHAGLGELDLADQRFRDWLTLHPAWGWGWIGWSDCYHLGPGSTDLDKACRILEEGLAVPGVRDAVDCLDRLQDVYEALGRTDEAERVRRRLAEAEAPALDEHEMDDEPLDAIRTGLEVSRSGTAVRVKSTFDFGPEGLPLEQLGRVRDHAASEHERILAEPGRKVGRNERCPCDSGKKFKKCCGR